MVELTGYPLHPYSILINRRSPVPSAASATQCPYTHAEDLAAEITELSAYLYAATQSA